MESNNKKDQKEDKNKKKYIDDGSDLLHEDRYDDRWRNSWFR